MKEVTMMDHIINSELIKTLSISSTFLAIFLTSPLSLAVPNSNADINGDVLTNTQDISLLSSCFGLNPKSNSAYASADVDEDLDIDSDDFEFVSERLGQTYPWILYSSPIVNIGEGGYELKRQLGDINKDGMLDILTLLDGNFTVWLGNGDGSLQEQQHYSSGFKDNEFALEDVNTDDKLDLVGIDSSGVDVAVRNVNGDGSFLQPQRYPAREVDSLMYLSDTNGDGKLDVLVSNTDNSISVLFGNVGGSFQESQHVYSCSPYCQGIREISDVNGDGIIDVIETHNLYSKFRVNLGNENGTYRPYQDLFFGGWEAHPFKLADLNGDGALDAAVPYSNGLQYYSIRVMALFKCTILS
jgi:hypothetical protein